MKFRRLSHEILVVFSSVSKIKFRRLSHQVMAVFIGVILVVLVLSGLGTTIFAQRIVTANIIRGQYDLAISLTDHILFELGNNVWKLAELTGKSTIKSMMFYRSVGIVKTELRVISQKNTLDPE